jgi:hypothetical protein
MRKRYVKESGRFGTWGLSGKAFKIPSIFMGAASHLTDIVSAFAVASTFSTLVLLSNVPADWS